jgi:ubiquinone/menaquinone biosynthesis C-methylase UbiE
VNEYPKAEAIKIAKRFDREFWDGDRKFGYGGYRYDGRWRPVAEQLARYYELKPGDRILDIGCGKGFLLYELTQVVPDIEISGIDISEYAITNAKEEVRPYLQVADASRLPFGDNRFELVFSLNTLHNLYCFDLENALREMERVGKRDKYLVVESYRNEEEKVNLMYWVLTGECFFSPEEWLWWFQRTGYSGDHSFIYFE